MRLNDRGSSTAAWDTFVRYPIGFVCPLPRDITTSNYRCGLLSRSPHIWTRLSDVLVNNIATTCRGAAGLPNGQVPVLVIDGFVLPQTLAILRYVGKLGGEALDDGSSSITVEMMVGAV